MTDDHVLHREIEAAKLLRDQLAALGQEDPDLLADMIEGETNLHEALAYLTAKINEDRAQVAGIEMYEGKIASRKKRLKTRIENCRALLALGMEVAGLKRIDTPAASVSLTAAQPKLIVTDESAIPARFWKAADPKLDMNAVKGEIKAGAVVPGCELSNGAPTVTIRRS